MLRALEETENALVAYRAQQQRLVKLADQARESTRAAAIARTRYREGLADFLALLDAERTQLQAEDAVAQAEAGVFTSVVARLQVARGDSGVGAGGCTGALVHGCTGAGARVPGAACTVLSARGVHDCGRAGAQCGRPGAASAARQVALIRESSFGSGRTADLAGRRVKRLDAEGRRARHSARSRSSHQYAFQSLADLATCDERRE